MKFLQVKIPKNNEYTYEQSQAIFSSIFSKKEKPSIFNFLSNNITSYSFNIISTNQVIYFIVGSLDNNITHLKNQILAQYPKADLIEMDNLNEMVNIKLRSAVYSNLVLASKNYLPIKTADKFQEIDPLASILSSMSRSQNAEDFFWIQIIISPDTKWQKKANKQINKIAAFENSALKTIEKTTLIQEKLKYHGFKTNIRIISNTNKNLKLISETFSVYSHPGSNHFKLSKINTLQEKSIQTIKAHKPDKKAFTLNSLELASIWHMPGPNVNIPNIAWGKRLLLEPPENLPIAYKNIQKDKKAEITFIGRTMYKNKTHTFGIKSSDRMGHVYIVGKTGTGKSWLIDNMVIEDIRKGNGIALLDPHGDAIEKVIQFIPKNRINDVCYFNPADKNYSYPLNILEVTNNNQIELLVSGIIAIFYKLYSHSWGPRLEHILRNILFTLVYAEDATLPDVMKIMHNAKYRNKILRNIDDPQIHQFWKKEYEKMGDRLLNESISPILNKVGQFVTSPIIRKVIQHPKSKVRIEDIMNNKKIFLCDLSQGKIGEDNATLLGSMIITKIQIAAMNRAFQQEKDRVPFYLYVDEFQNFATQSFTKILSEARKYRLGLTLANQYITQIDEQVMGAILGNIGTLACFNVGARDSEILQKEFGKQIEAEDITTLDRYQMLTRLAINNRTSDPFTSYSLPLPKNVSGHKEKIIRQSRNRYGIKI